MMPPENKRQFNGTLHPDVLSNLPENALDDILMRLPLREAVKTSILSKKWRYKWCRLPELKLDQTLWETTMDRQSSTIKFTDIMYHLLALHAGPITKFTLSFVNLGNCPKIDNLIYFLSRNGIENLILRFLEKNPYKLPSSFFTCSQLRHLALHYCLIHPPPAFKGFSKLVSLELYVVTISSELLGSLISGSPLLEQLVLHTLSLLDHIQINASMLRSFHFRGLRKFISLKNTPLLMKLSLVGTSGSSANAGPNDPIKYFESFPALEHLYMNYYSFQFLTAGLRDIPAKLSSPLNSLKCLQISYIRLDNFVELSYALCMIRSSPFLQDIQMKVYIPAEPAPGNAVIVNEIRAGLSDVTLNHLRAVKLEGITGTRPQMELIKLLLSKSPVLVRLQIQPKIGNEYPETRLKVLAEMMKFPRASPKAEVDYKVDDNPV